MIQNETGIRTLEAEVQDLVLSIAEICHAANRAYCRTLGDTSILPWEKAPNWQRKSAVSGVQYALGHPEAAPEDMHAEWLRHKLEDGWQFGETKNADEKEHPCIVPYSELPEEQRKKDALFNAVVNALK